MLTAYLRSSLDHTADVDDLFQETMLVAWRRIDDYDRDRPFGPWLRGIARHLVLAHYRKQGSAPQWCTPEVLDALDRRYEMFSHRSGDTFRDRLDALLTCLGKLSDRLRGVIEMIYARDMTYGEIAIATSEQESTIRKRAQRARALLHDCLFEETPR
ncbi:MAG: sigma-70 family RNA polymerase sigma factor [Acidimicrobiia bacterium]|nr:sigma-70 family RNA polymerase sigma factor [Acidimicrobiia bacterium]NNF43685.1 sigma-70 family RNA polymerase sigma factor [Phycisphaerales bacterium]